MTEPNRYVTEASQTDAIERAIERIKERISQPDRFVFAVGDEDRPQTPGEDPVGQALLRAQESVNATRIKLGKEPLRVMPVRDG